MPHNEQPSYASGGREDILQSETAHATDLQSRTDVNCDLTGLVLKGNVYQDLFEYSVSKTLTPWLRTHPDGLNASRLLMRPLPLRTLTVSILFSLIVMMLSVSVWFTWLPSFAVSYQEVFIESEWWRLFSAQFEHADTKHLLNNVLPFCGLGWILWGYFGFLAFPLVPVIAGAIANFLAVLTYEPHVRVVGLSGTVFAMAGLWSALYVKNDFRYPLSKRLLRAAGFILVLFFPLSLDPMVSDRVHFFGVALGLLIGSLGWGTFRPYQAR